jgi:electron transport complex protein RnfD
MKHTAGTLNVRSSPHIRSGTSVDVIMFNVALALLPVIAFAVFVFGLAALVTITVAVFSCLLAEHALCRWTGRPTTIGDWSVIVTGLLYGLTLPPSLPLWMVFVGGVMAVGLGKFLFGGLGYNVFNPALVGRAVLQAAFPAAMTSWPAMPEQRFAALPSSSLAWPMTAPVYDAVSGATPLAQWKFEQTATAAGDLLLGTISGSVGETSAILILLGGVYLAARRMLTWQIPVSILTTVAAFSGLLYAWDPSRFAGPLFMLLSGGLMLGAVFMATDMVASPMTRTGCLLYGVIIGILVVLIRVWGGLPEGVMYAILLGNACSPHVDHWIRPRVYGHSGKGGKR